MSTAHILFADDDASILELLRVTIQKADMIPLPASSGEQALEIWQKNSADLIILDVRMPGIDGLGTCRYIRRISTVPIMMLTSMGDEEDIVRGFEAGADDYLVKPFKPRELIARIRAILHRTAQSNVSPGSRLTFGDLTLEVATSRVTLGQESVSVTPLEFQLLHYLMRHTGKSVSKEDLFRNVWGYVMPAGGMNLVEVAIRRLREKIEPDPSRPRYIRTARGAGYRFGHG